MKRRLETPILALLAVGLALMISATSEARGFRFEARSLNGSGNHKGDQNRGAVGSNYRRIAEAAYGGGSGMLDSPAPRYVSNRVFNDLGQNVFSEIGTTQWVWTWGQFMDHTFGLADAGDEAAPIAFDPKDPLETFENSFGEIAFTRDAAAPGTGDSTGNPRESVNTVSSYIDGWSVYGGTRKRLDWLRKGSNDGKPRNNSPRLLLDHGYLPRADARGDADAAPEMEAGGQLQADPSSAMVAGDVRANENVALTAVQTLLAREHNRIVKRLPRRLGANRRFEIARRIVGAEQQYITYKQFLPAVGLRLPRYRGYDRTVDPTLTTEFATVGYRNHSMIHGEFEIVAESDRYTQADLTALEAMGVEVNRDDDEIELVVPLGVAFFNPDLLPLIGAGPMLTALGAERQYNNDEQFDDALRSLLFQVPGQGSGVVDLGAIDIQRSIDHGIGSYNDLRRAYGLQPARSFTDVTGETTERFPRGRGRGSGAIDNPASIEYIALFDSSGDRVDPESDQAESEVTRAVRASPLAARLKAIYGSVERLNAFVGTVSEPHLPGTELGELQRAIWERQFAALRDGDRFFYRNDPALRKIQRRYGISFRQGLKKLIVRNSDATAAEVGGNPFLVGEVE